MSIWWVVALSMILLGIIFAILADRNYWSMDGAECFGIAVGACVLEAIIYGFYRLIPWVLSWNTGIVVKISFIAIPSAFMLGLLFTILATGSTLNQKKSLRIFGCVAVLMVAMFVAAVIVCPVFAFITKMGWRIGVLGVLGIPWTFILSASIYAVLSDKPEKKSGSYNGCGGYGVAEGPHGEYVGYYSSRKEYRESRDQLEKRGWDWGGPAV